MTPQDEAHIKALEEENRMLREDNNRLRWRHPVTIPEWNDLPQALRIKLCDLGDQYAVPYFGGDFVVNFYSELRAALQKEPQS